MTILRLTGRSYLIALFLLLFATYSTASSLSENKQKVRLSAPRSSLEDIISETLRTHPDLLAQLKSFLAARHRIRAAKGGYLPNIGLSGNAGRQNISYRGFGILDYQHFKPTSANINLTQMVFDGFATPELVAKQKHQMATEKYQLSSVTNEVVFQVIRVYLGVLRSSKIVTIAEANYQAHLKTYNIIKERAQSGIDRPADAKQAFGRLAVAKSSVLSAKNDYADALDAFLQVTGRSPEQLNLFMPDAPPSALLPADKEEAQNVTIANHPLLKAANASIADARANYKVQQATNYPTLNLVAAATHGAELGNVKGRYNENTLGLQMNYSLFKGGSDQAHKDEAAELIGKAKANRDKTYRSVLENVQTAWNYYVISNDQLALFREHEQASQVTVKAYRDQFKLNRRSLLDLLNSQDELFNARVDWINGDFNFLFAKFRLLYAEGILLSQLKIGLSSTHEGK